MAQGIAMLDYTPEYKEIRRLALLALSPASVETYVPIQERVVQDYLLSLLEDPEAFLDNLW